MNRPLPSQSITPSSPVGDGTRSRLIAAMLVALVALAEPQVKK